MLYDPMTPHFAYFDREKVQYFALNSSELENCNIHLISQCYTFRYASGVIDHI